MNKVATAKEVLWNARKQIPNALVLYVGFFFSVYFQADEESRRNQLMRDMAQLRLQVREVECWLISVVKSKGSEMTNQRWNGFIGVHVMVNNFHFLILCGFGESFIIVRGPKCQQMLQLGFLIAHQYVDIRLKLSFY